MARAELEEGPRTVRWRDGMRDLCFKVMHQDEVLSLVTRCSAGQMIVLKTTAQRVLGQGDNGDTRATVHLSY